MSVKKFLQVDIEGNLEIVEGELSARQSHSEAADMIEQAVGHLDKMSQCLQGAREKLKAYRKADLIEK